MLRPTIRTSYVSIGDNWFVVATSFFLFFFQAEDGIRDLYVTGVQTCALPICRARACPRSDRTRGCPVDLWRRGTSSRRTRQARLSRRPPDGRLGGRPGRRGRCDRRRGPVRGEPGRRARPVRPVDWVRRPRLAESVGRVGAVAGRSEEHTSELQSRRDLVCRLLLEK